mmetsp:Transcript_2283/g.5344  ORF Transcript_2283/g.5344 Transcript_2283/m.5344 type:complete len:337 (-) Transcript_2283:26-1036(-)
MLAGSKRKAEAVGEPANKGEEKRYAEECCVVNDEVENLCRGATPSSDARARPSAPVRGLWTATPNTSKDVEQLEDLRVLFAMQKWHGNIDPRYMDRQSWKVDRRPMVVEFMLDVAATFHYDNETVATAVSMFDRYLSLNVVEDRLLRPLAAASLFSSGKFNETWDDSQPLSIFADRFGCTEASIIEFELKVLNIVGWTASAVTAVSILRSLLAMSPRNKLRLERYGSMFVDMLMCDSKALKFSPTTCALAAVRASSNVLHLNTEWLDKTSPLLSKQEIQDVEEARALIMSLYSDMRSSYAGSSKPATEIPHDSCVSPCCVVTDAYSFEPIHPDTGK